MREVTVSVVSHQHGAFLPALLQSLAQCPEIAKVILTSNLPEALPEPPTALAGRLCHIQNAQPAGFGANHNAAFAHCETPYFAVLNPDIRFEGNPFPALLLGLSASRCGVIAPAVTSPEGHCEDNARVFPTPLGLLAKASGKHDGRIAYVLGGAQIVPDWVAGMFMLLPSAAFRAVNGFDSRFFLYYEDVDLCARLGHAGYSVLLEPGVSIVHDAHRSSRHSPRYFLWHLRSLLRFWAKHLGRFPMHRG